ncbi:HAD family hydrolase [Streptomyces sp. NPDC088812]|uniref:HAD family hydrolase n=1 Tax=Streptomyces sp. NPDC088812 TaxID=3365905 RepID=UPI00382E2982
MVRRPLGNHHLGPDTHLVTAESSEFRELVVGAKVVLWDFDGPICRLFAGCPAEDVAHTLVRWLRERDLAGLLTESERRTADPLAVLRAVDRAHPGGDLVAELEEQLTRAETRACPSAMPTAYADPLIRTWTALGVRMAITTDVSARAVAAYLAGRGLTSCFASSVHGRTADLGRPQPRPHPLHRALAALGAAPHDALAIGGSPTAALAAAEAGVPFLGYARGEAKAALLRDAGVTRVVASLEPVLTEVRRTAPVRARVG